MDVASGNYEKDHSHVNMIAPKHKGINIPYIWQFSSLKTSKIVFKQIFKTIYFKLYCVSALQLLAFNFLKLVFFKNLILQTLAGIRYM